MINVDLSDRIVGFCNGILAYNIVPNFLSYLIDFDTIETDKLA